MPPYSYQSGFLWQTSCRLLLWGSAALVRSPAEPDSNIGPEKIMVDLVALIVKVLSDVMLHGGCVTKLAVPYRSRVS
jgi:hypothetical protein